MKQKKETKEVDWFRITGAASKRYYNLPNALIPWNDKTMKKKETKKAEAKHERTESSLEKLFEKVTKDSDRHSFAQFKTGYAVEQEHKNVTKGDPLKTAKIVMAHLKEVPDYYTKLKKVEKPAKKK